MPTALRTPRVNTNDDVVRLTLVLVTPGDHVKAGDIVAEVETDKTNFVVEADHPGFVLAVVPQVNDMINVGSVLLWLGTTPDESVPQTAATSEREIAIAEPTVKAAQLLRKYGLRAIDVPASGARLGASDVEAYVGYKGLQPIDGAVRDNPAAAASPKVSATPQVLTPEERGVLRTVLWHRQEPVTAYVELQYDAAAWDRFAAEYQQREHLLLSPLLALMAYQLVKVARENPRLNSTIVGDQRLVYDTVNLGFTVQSQTTLYLAVVENAAVLSCREFVDRLGQLQRNALANRLHSHETSGATIAFSSMARWNVTRHIPVLPPHTALIVAHAASSSSDRQGVLGATYDHRILTGLDAVSGLKALSQPEIIQ